MKIILTSHSLSRSELEAGISLTRAFFPEARILVEEHPINKSVGESSNWVIQDSQKTDALIRIEVSYPMSPWKVDGYFVRVIQAGNEPTAELGCPVHVQLDHNKVQTILLHNQVGKETEKKLLLKQGLYSLLTQVTSHVPPWGILTGIRPSKILHSLNDLNISNALAKRILKERYSIREDKVHLLQSIVSTQSHYLQEIEDHPKGVAIYVGIPFCPTRCTYCSFPAYSLQQGREPLKAYLKGLYDEIRATGGWMKEEGLYADSLYIGGGTPTILTTPEISELIQWIQTNIPIVKSLKKEFTVEAGRPDTLTKDKLQALRDLGVNRLSINPQTMHERTLKRIGRSHSVEDILSVYALAREISEWVINMDLILGLPGETVHDVHESLKQVSQLNPDNLTVHALAIKRGSKEHETGYSQSLMSELEMMQEIVLSGAYAFGLHPYYLYRQKNISGNLENIGFARPGLECRYNIGIMEERQNVIGMGAGASSKVVNPLDYSLVNLQHPSNWQTYLIRWEDNHQKRVREWARVKCSQKRV
jgi:oxygen-independent coproporphyrinogen III oxidase